MHRILVVDDDEAVRSIVSRMLLATGYDVASACGGRKALDVLDEQMPDLVVSDIDMPEMDGRALLRELRTRDAQLPVIGMSGHRCGEELERCGFDAFLAKPFRMEALVETVGRVLTAQPTA
jgi:CheY-like chemotaxis protein